MPLHYGLPPYADIVFQPDLQDRLGNERLGILCRMIALAKPTGDGGWVINARLEDLAEAIGVPRGRLSRELKFIASTGALEIGERTFYGNERRSTSYTYFLYPSLLNGTTLPSPAGPPDPDRMSHSRTFGNGTVGSGTFGGRHLAAVPASPDRPVVTHSDGKHVVVDDSQQQHSPAQNRAQSASDPETAPTSVLDALDDIGWSAAIPSGQPWDLLLAVITDLKAKQKANKIDSAAAVLNSLLRRDGLAKYARGNRLLATDLNNSLPGDTNTPRMTGLEFDLASEAHPEWAETVRAEAKRQASIRGLLPRVPPSLIWQVAATIPLPVTQSEHGS